jgi:hypothetical protein
MIFSIDVIAPVEFTYEQFERLRWSVTLKWVALALIATGIIVGIAIYFGSGVNFSNRNCQAHNKNRID